MSSEKEKYIAYCQENPDIPLFFNHWWLDTVCKKGSWKALIAEDKNGNTIGVWPLYIENKLGQSVIKMPPITPYLGPHIKTPNQLKKLNSIYSYNRKVLNQLIDQIPRFLYFNVLCHPNFTQLLPLKWKGYKQTNELTYVINDLTDTKKVYDNFASSARNKITKAEKIFYIDISQNIKPLLNLVDLSFQRKNIKNKITLGFLENLVTVIKDNGYEYSVIYAKHDNQYLGGNFIVYDRTTAYNLLSGADPICIKEGAIPLIIWRAILEASFKVKSFDFEGGLIEPIEVFFRSFGAQQSHYSRFVKSKNILTDFYLLMTGKI
jgi:hypothetical protein